MSRNRLFIFNEKNDIAWVKFNKEFSYKGYLYDISYSKDSVGKVFIVAHKDKKETEFLEKLGVKYDVYNWDIQHQLNNNQLKIQVYLPDERDLFPQIDHENKVKFAINKSRSQIHSGFRFKIDHPPESAA